EEHPDELHPFPQQLFTAMNGGWMHLGGDEHTAVDPDKECYPAGQGVGAIAELTPAGEIVRRLVAEADEVLARLDQVRA
ncbi:MAG: NAD(P)H-dependent flavin oxidoreductase, partial [Acidimicrobiia bacterium]